MNLYIVSSVFLAVAALLIMRAYFYKKRNNPDAAFLYLAVGILILVFSIMGFLKFRNYYVIAAVILVYYFIIAFHDAKKKNRKKEEQSRNTKSNPKNNSPKRKK